MFSAHGGHPGTGARLASRRGFDPASARARRALDDGGARAPRRAARARPRVGFAGIHATPLRLAGFDVTVVEPDPAYFERARERAGDVLPTPPPEPFDAVVAPAGADLGEVVAGKLIVVARRRHSFNSDVTAVALWDELLQGEEVRASHDRAGPRGPHRADSGDAAAGAARRAGPPRDCRALRAPGSGVRRRGRRAARDRHDRYGVRQDARVQPPGLEALAADPKSCALYLYPTKVLAQDQARGARRAGGSRRARRDLRRRHAAANGGRQIRRWANRRADEPRHAPHRRAAAPRPLGRLPPQPALRRRRTRRTSTAASSDRMSRTCCGGCGGSRGSTARIRSSCSRRRRSRIPASSRTSCSGVDAAVVGDDAAPRAERTVALWNPPLIDAELGLRASALGEASRLLAELVSRGSAHDLLREEPQDGGADPPIRVGPRQTPRRRSGSRRIASATRRGDAPRYRAAPRLAWLNRSASPRCTHWSGHRHWLLSPPSIRASSVGFPGTAAGMRQHGGSGGLSRSWGSAMLVAREDVLVLIFHARSRRGCSADASKPGLLHQDGPWRVLDGDVLCRRAPGDRRATRAPARRSARRCSRNRAPLLPELRKDESWRGLCWLAGARRSPAAPRRPGRRGADRELLRSPGEGGSALGTRAPRRACSLDRSTWSERPRPRSDVSCAASTSGAARRRPPFRGDLQEGEEGDEKRRSRRSGAVSMARPRAELRLVSVTEHVVARQQRCIRDGAVIATVSSTLPPSTFETEAVWYVPTPSQLDGLDAAAAARVAARGRAS